MRIEAIFKQSCIQDIHHFWALTGRHPNAYEDGQAIFENVKSYEINLGTIIIETEEATYIYTISDFYRFKVIQ